MSSRILLLSLLLPACQPKSLPCGTGTHEEAGTCVADEPTDTGPATDTDPTTDTGSTTDTDTAPTTDSDPDSTPATDSDPDSTPDTDPTDTDTDPDIDLGPCAPPDTWTADIDPALYTSVPYDATYDAGLAEIAANMPSGSVSSSGGSGYLVYDATVVAIGDYDGTTYKEIFVADGSFTLHFQEDGYARDTFAVGDRIGFATDALGSYYDDRSIEDYSGYTVLSAGNPVYVRELGAENLDYLSRFNQLTHLYGEITRASGYDCGDIWDYGCYIVEHDGTEDLIRLTAEAAESFGLGPDYSGGLCAEVIAPVNMFDGDGNAATFLDVIQSDWLRTWDL